jgi:NAD(P)-dependent dehydrogenase (short-subunit alcohol dehydrogenase family)
MTGAGQRVAIITGGSRGIGACPVAAYRRRDWAVAANSRTIKPSEDGAVLTKRLHTFSAPGCASSRL